jgi:hypothetical protein
MTRNPLRRKITVKNNVSNDRKLVNTSIAGKDFAVHKLNRKNTETLDRLHKLISDELSKPDRVVSIEGRSIIKVIQSSAGFVGVLYGNDGSYGETPSLETYDAAVIEARWRAQAWHDKPILIDDKRPSNGKKTEI